MRGWFAVLMVVAGLHVAALDASATDLLGYPHFLDYSTAQAAKFRTIERDATGQTGVLYGNGSNISAATSAQMQAAIGAGVYDSYGAAAAVTASLATVATTGTYSDLTGKPTIPAAQVNSDWTAGSGVAQILNKPTLGGFAALTPGTLTNTNLCTSDGTTIACTTSSALFQPAGSYLTTITDSTSTTSSTAAASATAVKSANDNANTRALLAGSLSQPFFTSTLVSKGVDGTTSYLVHQLNGGASGYGAFLNFSDGFTYNFAIGTDPTSGDFTWYSARYPGVAGTPRMRVSQSGIVTTLGTTDASSTAAASVVASGGLGVAKKTYMGDDLHFARTITVNNSTPTTVALGYSIYLFIRNVSVGGYCVVSYESGETPTIISQSSANMFTTGSPSATQIQLTNRATLNAGVTAISGATRNGDSITIAAIIIGT